MENFGMFLICDRSLGDEQVPDGRIVFRPDEDVDVIATFKKDPSITATVLPDSTAGTVSPLGPRNPGTAVIISATPAAGYRFVQMVINGEVSFISNQMITMPDGDVIVTATFEPDV